MLLDVSNLSAGFRSDSGWLRAVDGVSFSIDHGQTVGLVGESGCGKSVTAMSIVQLLPRPSGEILGGSIRFDGKDLAAASPAELYAIRGGRIGVIFQEPMTALNPVHSIGRQIAEVLSLHSPDKLSRREASLRAADLLAAVRIPSPHKRLTDFPHQLSGGMRQRVVIAMAIACNPSLVIADEPTTALDVTVQAQILELLSDLQRQHGSSTLLITHDLGVIAQNCQHVVVMYAGRAVERAPVAELFSRPAHAYTRMLLESIPRMDSPRKQPLPTIPGQVAAIADFVPGCRFCQRLGRTGETLLTRPPTREISPGHFVEACPLCATP